jgi:hypothetical protein
MHANSKHQSSYTCVNLLRHNTGTSVYVLQTTHATIYVHTYRWQKKHRASVHTLQYNAYDSSTADCALCVDCMCSILREHIRAPLTVSIHCTSVTRSCCITAWIVRWLAVQCEPISRCCVCWYRGISACCCCYCCGAAATATATATASNTTVRWGAVCLVYTSKHTSPPSQM